MLFSFRFQNHRYKTKRATHDKRGSISVGSEMGQGLYHSHHGAGDHNAVAAAAALKQAQQQQQSNHHHHHHQVSVSAAAHHAHDFLAATVAAAHRNQAAVAAAAVAQALNGGSMIGDVVGQSHHVSVGPNSVATGPVIMHDKHWPQQHY